MEKIVELSTRNYRRTLVVSDIHGELGLLQELLEKTNFTADDCLIINGDLCEKGSSSSGVIQYVRELAGSHPHVYVTEGNCEAIMDHLLEENQELIDYLIAREKSLYNEWLLELGFVLSKDTRIKDVKELLTLHYSEEIDWITSLPTAIETEDFIFVHAGIENREDWRETPRIAALTMPEFLGGSHMSEKVVVVGHWPVSNYPFVQTGQNPYIDREKKIIAIDGGNVLKQTGQLNALIIQYQDGVPRYSHAYADSLPAMEVQEDFHADITMQGAVKYPNYDMEILRRGKDFTLCRQASNGTELYLKNEYIIMSDDGNCTARTDVACCLLSVKKGDIVSVVDENCTGFVLIKKDGREGWAAASSLKKHSIVL
ncbi:metallophosphoesterase [Peribacillus sp. SCS-37]|uniref:metallophosphoesterase n=1 Tax=Paraperibacillus esterisolvens TaxID=3115296 RepID=UPI003905C372